MGIETLGEAWNLSWEIHVRCLHDGREGMKHKRACGYRKYLDLETLVCTRGRDFPIARIAERLRCPTCGCRQVLRYVQSAQDTPDQRRRRSPYRDV